MRASGLMRALILVACVGLLPSLVQAQTVEDRTQDKVAFPAFKIMGNLYYVGTGTLNSYLITTPAGNHPHQHELRRHDPAAQGVGREGRFQDDRRQDDPGQPCPRRSPAG